MSNHHQPAFQLRFLLPKYWLIWLVVLLCGITALMPTRMRAGLGDRLAMRLFRKNSRGGHIAATNLALCYPELDEDARQELLRRYARITAHIYLGYGQLMFGSQQKLLDQCDFHGMENMHDAMAAGDNIIMLTPHFVALEHGAACIKQHHEAMTMVRVHSNRLLDWLVTRVRTRGTAVIYSKDEKLLSLIKAIRRGRWFYYLPEEDRGAAGSIFVPFCGIPKATLPFLGKIARAGQAVVIPTLTHYSPETTRFSVRFLPPLRGFPTGDPQQDALIMNQTLEALIGQDPAQYMWVNKIFRTRPEGEASFY